MCGKSSITISFQARIKQLGVNIVNLKISACFLRVPKRFAWEIKRYYLGVQVQLTFSLYGTAHLLQALICVPKKRRTLACTQSGVMKLLI
jgi:hypothetical protein